MTGSSHHLVLDPFQHEAVAAIDDGRSVLVAAPTGAGKTLIAEHAIATALSTGSRAFYTTPVKALSNQKFRDLASLHGRDAVGLLTGDNSINPEAPAVVMTTEVLRNMLYAQAHDLGSLGWVVLDEVHFLQDPYRGSVWEEVVIHTPKAVRFVYLSATVSNVSEVAGWLCKVRGETAVVVEHRRPIELRHQIIARNRHKRRIIERDTVIRGRPNRATGEWGSTPRPRIAPRGRHGTQLATPRRVQVVDWLADGDLLPAIYFIFSRAGCDDALARLAGTGESLTSPSEASRIRQIFEEHMAVLPAADRAVLGIDAFGSALARGFGAHHAGLVPPVKEAVEECFAAGLVKVVFATETLALGVNMPARSVVIESLTKFGGERHDLLSPAQYTQLAGRAGRRGLDPVGHALVLWSPYVGFDQVAALASSREFRLVSSFTATYNMVANLVRHHDPRRARELLELSFAQYQADLRRTDGRRDPSLSRRFEAVLQLLEAWEHLAGWSLTDRGLILAGVFHESDLLVAEALSRGILDGLGPAELAGLVSCVTYEHRSRLPAPEPWFPTDDIQARFGSVYRLAEELAADEEHLGLTQTRLPDPSFLPLAHAWAGGARLADVLDEDVLSGGDFVRNARQIADLLRQIGSVAPDRRTRATARRAAALMMRGVVSTSPADDLSPEAL